LVRQDRSPHPWQKRRPWYPPSDIALQHGLATPRLKFKPRHYPAFFPSKTKALHKTARLAVFESMNPPVQLSTLHADQHEEVAALLHRSLVHWYETRLGEGHRFGTSSAGFRIFPELYAALDPGEAICAKDANGKIRGVCFVHARETHVSIGIVATDPDFSGRGMARRMMEMAMDRAQKQHKPVRLVSSLMNLDSFSLYTRLGFVPGSLFQDIEILVPDIGLPQAPPEGLDRIRLASSTEAGRLADLEFKLQRIRREKDYAFFLNNTSGEWQVWVHENQSGELCGFMVASQHPDWNMIGPGTAVDAQVAEALIWKSLDHRRGKRTVILAPCSATSLVAALYAWGGRNIELHVAQSTAPFEASTGLTFPTFLPESA
jgi:ribosomal protein S18 acetylase RimI-like enzyme